MTTKRGRPAEYGNAAEKQKAYRERKKAAALADANIAALVAEVEEKAKALRNSIRAELEKNKQVELFISNSLNYAQMLVRGYSHYSINTLVFRHMIREGELVFIRKDWNGEYYKLKDDSVS